MATRSLIDRTGPAWSERELRVFWEQIQANGKNWKTNSEALPSRNAGMLRALYTRHKKCLDALDSAADEFISQVTEHQTSSGMTSPPLGDVLYPEGDERTYNIAEEPHSVTKKRKQKRDRKGYAVEAVLADAERDGGLSALTQFAHTASEEALTSSESKAHSPRKQLNFKRGTVKNSNSMVNLKKVGRGNGKRAKLAAKSEADEEGVEEEQTMDIMDDTSWESEDDHDEIQRRQYRLQQLRSNGSEDHSDHKHSYMSVDVRKLDLKRAPHLGGETLAEMQSEFSHCMSLQHFRRWAIYEWFYSAVDRLYFSQNDFIECMCQSGFGNFAALTRKEWGVVRGKIGRPRRLSRVFFTEERAKLEAFRSKIRSAQQSNNCDVPSRLAEGQRVFVLHQELQEVHVGLITGYAHLQSLSSQSPVLHYRVKFEWNKLTTALVPDIDVMPRGILTRWNGSTGVADAVPISGGAERDHQAPYPREEKDLRVVCTLLRLLDRKRALVDQLQSMNVAAEKIKTLLTTSRAQATTTDPTNCATTFTAPSTTSPLASNPKIYTELPTSFQQQYACVLVQLERTSKNLEETLAMLRSRRSSVHRQPVSMSEEEPDSYDRLRVKESQRVSRICKLLVKNGSIPSNSILASANGANIHGVIVQCVTFASLVRRSFERGYSSIGIDIALQQLLQNSSQDPQNRQVLDDIRESVAALSFYLSSPS
jgi:hypothetical protein